MFVPSHVSLCGVGCPQGKGGDGGSDHGLGVRLLEATDIATMDDKMLMEKAPSNASWTSAGFMHT